MKTIIQSVAKRLDSAKSKQKPRTARQAADVARDAKDYAAAARLYKEHLSGDPNDGPIHVQAGHMLKETGALAEAGTHYIRAASILPRDADLQVQLGHFYKVTDRLDDAIEAYRRAVELNPNDEDARFQLKDALRLREAPPQVTPRQVLLARTRLASAPAEYLRNVPAAEFAETAGRIAENRCFHLIEAVDQRFPDPELTENDLAVCLRVCVEARAFDLAIRVATVALVATPDARIPLSLLTFVMQAGAAVPEGQLVAIPMQAQLAMLGAATNVIARQRTIIENFVG